ncbi:MAG: hypothetical protein OXH38_04715 [Chloroflexi bacterium]|nr:hypothetical protein [Chloroflexota bacterium]
MIALARTIVAGEGDPGSVESVFAQAQQVAAEAEALLVDEGWPPEPESVVATETADAVVDDRDSGAQRALFSWAEFMAGEFSERQPKPRRGEAPTLSLFEWALDREQKGTLAGAAP